MNPTDNILSRAELLIRHRKFDEAGRLLTDLLRQEPDNASVLAALAEVRLNKNDGKEADRLIKSAIGLSPGDDALHLVNAQVEVHNDRYDRAEESLRQAVSLNPANANAFAFWATVKLERKQYAPALELADEALALDPENVLALNTRSTALLKLNRKDESNATIEGALNEDPNNAFTHANYGWNLLEKGEHNKALEHFREALRNDPTNEFAQSGMIEALKARYLFYRWFLKYSFFMSNLTAKYQWAVIIGFYICVRALRTVAKNNEALQPVLIPVLVVLGLVAFSTWVIGPLSNLFLRLNPYGKHLLDEQETLSSNFVALSLAICLVGLLAYVVLGDVKWITVAAFGFAMMLPLGSMFAPAKNKYALVLYTAAMALIGSFAIAQTFFTGEVFNVFIPVFILSFVAFQWVASFMIIRQSNR
ncbi:MAG TPA: tetratricopeptide repeat protein [Chitinophagales bacterium]|nr:tetratricopeptide repeat protein [Chitinophagales bacterium]